MCQEIDAIGINTILIGYDYDDASLFGKFGNTIHRHLQLKSSFYIV